MIAIATHTETGEEMVVYQGLYGEKPIFVRPLEMFVSKVDKEKFPNIEQENRFELEEDTAVSDTKEQSILYRFLDLSSANDKIEFLQSVKEEITEEFLDIAAQSMDFTESKESLEERYNEFIRYLRTVDKYESGRLR